MTNFFGGVLWEHIEGELLVVLRNYQFTKKVIKVFVRKKWKTSPFSTPKNLQNLTF